MKFAAWLGGATAQCMITFAVTFIMSLFIDWHWITLVIIFAVSAWWGGGKALVKYERELYMRGYNP